MAMHSLISIPVIAMEEQAQGTLAATSKTFANLDTAQLKRHQQTLLHALYVKAQLDSETKPFERLIGRFLKAPHSSQSQTIKT